MNTSYESLNGPTKPLRRLVTIRSSNVDKVMEEGEETVRLCNYVDVYYNDRITGDMAFSDGSAKPREIAKFALSAGDVVITKDSETPDDIAVPALVEPSAEGVVCGYHLAILRPNPSEIFGPFLFWALMAKPTREAFGNAAQGITRYGLTLNGIGSISIPVPDLDTQKGIAAYLDRETARIQAAGFQIDPQAIAAASA
jgi:type I restriction enzyme S subunit